MTGPWALTPATEKHGCLGCHDRSWNGHQHAPRGTMPMRCPTCPVHRVMTAGGVPIDLSKVSVYGGYEKCSACQGVGIDGFDGTQCSTCRGTGLKLR